MLWRSPRRGEGLRPPPQEDASDEAHSQARRRGPDRGGQHVTRAVACVVRPRALVLACVMRRVSFASALRTLTLPTALAGPADMLALPDTNVTFFHVGLLAGIGGSSKSSVCRVGARRQPNTQRGVRGGARRWGIPGYGARGRWVEEGGGNSASRCPVDSLGGGGLSPTASLPCANALLSQR